jgi:hypothetical protein
VLLERKKDFASTRMEHGVLLLVWLAPHSMDALPNQFPRSASLILMTGTQDGWICWTENFPRVREKNGRGVFGLVSEHGLISHSASMEGDVWK